MPNAQGTYIHVYLCYLTICGHVELGFGSCEHCLDKKQYSNYNGFHTIMKRINNY